MSDLKQIIAVLSEKEMSRKQFLELTGGSFLGMIGFFRILQALNTPQPTLATSHKEVFGEREYGHPSQREIEAAKVTLPKFDEDVFG